MRAITDSGFRAVLTVLSIRDPRALESSLLELFACSSIEQVAAEYMSASDHEKAFYRDQFGYIFDDLDNDFWSSIRRMNERHVAPETDTVSPVA
ncbi:MAG TPA: hypothetical protein VEZ11_08860 [Thermoanaerobaculia bacterium]|nr:hypothetical protein [Thermoanaerobaculia bacterium]